MSFKSFFDKLETKSLENDFNLIMCSIGKIINSDDKDNIKKLLGDIAVTGISSIKFLLDDHEISELVISNVCKNLIKPDEKSINSSKDILKLATTEVYECDILCVYDILEEVNPLLINDVKLFKYHVAHELSIRLSKLFGLLSSGKIVNDDDKKVVAISISMVIALSFYFIKLLGDNPFNVILNKG